MANVSELNEVQLFIDHMPFDNTQLFQGDFRKRKAQSQNLWDLGFRT